MQLFEEAGRPVERAVFTMFVFVVERCDIPRCKIHVLREIDRSTIFHRAHSRAGHYSPYSSVHVNEPCTRVLPTTRYKM